MHGDALARHDDPLDGLRTVHLIEEALVQRGLRQLRALLREGDGRALLDELAANAFGSLHELDEILEAWGRERAGGAAPPAPELPAPDREEILRSFQDLKDSEAMVLRRAARAAPEALRPRLEHLAQKAEDHARRLERLAGKTP